MKTLCLLIASTFGVLSTAQAQSCRKVEIASTIQEKQVLKQFIDECHTGRYFMEDKGIVSLTAYRDGKGRQVWSMYAMIDDRYQDNPPTAYSDFRGDIVLVYQADSTGHILPAVPNTDKAAINRCLEEVIINRVYQRPKIRERYVETPGPNGTTRKSRAMTVIGGNYWNDKIIVFNKDGTYRVYIGV